MTGRVSSRHPAVSILGVTLTPCAEGPCETGCLALLPDISFFLEKVRTVSACIGINLPLKKRPAVGGKQPTPPWRRWRKHRANVHLHSLPRIPRSPMPPAGGKLAAIRRRKEKNVNENKKEHHLHIVLTTQQYQLLCCQAKECRLTKRAYLARLIEGRPVKARPTKEIKELRTEIHHIGNNINQIARSVNAGIAKPEDAERGLYLLDQVYELMFRIANK